MENAESYHEVFKVLDSLGMADLKETFQEHCIQDQTLRYVETEDELKQLLREIGIPLGRCIPIMKSWRKRYSSQETVRRKDKVSTAENYSQTSTVTVDASIQTEDMLISAAEYNKLLNNMAELNTQQELLNHYAALASGEFNLKLTEAQSGSLTSAQVPSSYGTQSLDPYTAAQLWSNLSQYQDQFNMYGGFLQATTANAPGGIIPDGIGSEASTVIYNQNMNDVNHMMVPSAPSPVPSQDMGQYQRVTANVSERKDIVDEREDLAIEQSLKDVETMELESQHSYASALNTEAADLSQDSQHNYGSITEQTSYYMQSSQRTPSTYTSHSQVRPTQTTARPVPSEKLDTSRFAKCDDISLESGTSRLPSSVQSVGPQTLQGYLDSLPESNEYKEAMKSKNPKKGWKPIDGKHIQTAKKVAFKPVYWDKEGRMRHGVAVRGSDKSEECWRHVEGKAPAGCTFAHSRLGDTLQFICVKCSYERNRNDWCSDKTKHKQYIFNLGPYRNLEGGVWKKIS